MQPGFEIINSLRPRGNRRHFADDIFKCISLNEYVWISLKISLEFVPKVPISNFPALVLVMAWRRPGDKPLSEPRVESLLTHICVTRPQWVKGRCVTCANNKYKFGEMFHACMQSCFVSITAVNILDLCTLSIDGSNQSYAIIKCSYW